MQRLVPTRGEIVVEALRVDPAAVLGDQPLLAREERRGSGRVGRLAQDGFDGVEVLGPHPLDQRAGRGDPDQRPGRAQAEASHPGHRDPGGGPAGEVLANAVRAEGETARSLAHLGGDVARHSDSSMATASSAVTGPTAAPSTVIIGARLHVPGQRVVSREKLPSGVVLPAATPRRS